MPVNYTAEELTNVYSLLFLLQHLDLTPGTGYAITTITKYLLMLIGGLVGFSMIGIEWSKLQWLVAALGVGLGFGLQEIFANFISGLIILFEKPIRIGDTVAVYGLGAIGLLAVQIARAGGALGPRDCRIDLRYSTVSAQEGDVVQALVAVVVHDEVTPERERIDVARVRFAPVQGPHVGQHPATEVGDDAAVLDAGDQGGAQGRGHGGYPG